MLAQKKAYTYYNQTLLRPKLFNPLTKDLTVYVFKITN